MRQVTMTPAIAAACEQLFGRERPATIERAALSRRYRERAFASHPDRALALGRSSAELADGFLRLSQAHALLLSLFEGETKVRLVDDPSSPATARRPARRSRRSTGQRPPSFAEFLYYSGRITFAQLVEIQAWQRRHRPQVGRIAMEWGLLSSGEVRAVLERQHQGERFCDAAVHCGLLTRPQRLAVLGRQRQLERCVDDYLLARGMMAADELAALRQRARAAAVPGCR